MKKITLENKKVIEISDESYKALEEGVKVCNKNWRAEKGEKYWYISSDWIIIIMDEECFNLIDNYRYNTLNYFKTEEEAEKKRDKDLAIGKVTRAIWEANGDWTPNWEDESKYYFYNSFLNEKINYDWGCITQHLSILPYMKSQEITKQIIKDYQKELELILEV